MRPEPEDFLKYLKTWRTSSDIKDFFDMSKSEFHSFVRFYIKTGSVVTINIAKKDKPNREFLYRSVNN